MPCDLHLTTVLIQEHAWASFLLALPVYYVAPFPCATAAWLLNIAKFCERRADAFASLDDCFRRYPPRCASMRAYPRSSFELSGFVNLTLVFSLISVSPLFFFTEAGLRHCNERCCGCFPPRGGATGPF